ncbi:uncharacterized protein [Malus domestica]|uniref:uncharacterized protein n=1 Tax=Malus domestica TaxID=3750 RepID=UPI0039755208
MGETLNQICCVLWVRAEIANTEKRVRAAAAIGNPVVGYNANYGNPKSCREWETKAESRKKNESKSKSENESKSNVIKKCHDRMMKEYFIECPRFPAYDFRRRFQMKRKLFESILNAIVNHDHYFARKIDVVGRQSLSPHQKLTSAFRMLANGCSADSNDEYCRLAESTAIKNLKHLC